jgi:coenzyme PQQ precursor peptide PqqA
MKIMRADSWPRDCRRGRLTATMVDGTLGPASQEIDMTWQTPQAQDFRFGFEITMYVAAR